MSDRKKKRDKEENWLTMLCGAIASAVIIVFTKLLWPDLIPFEVFQFWHLDFSFGALLGSTWPLLTWGAGATTAYTFLTRKKVGHDAETVLKIGAIISVLAGVFEEICYRWLIFLGSMAGIVFANWLIFDWFWVGLPELFYDWLGRPIANFTTLGQLSGHLPSGNLWYVGAALLAANTRFKNGHQYLGPVGYVNSWFIGMYFFWVMFRYGLPAAILTHILYDLCVFGALAVRAKVNG